MKSELRGTDEILKFRKEKEKKLWRGNHKGGKRGGRGGFGSGGNAERSSQFSRGKKTPIYTGGGRNSRGGKGQAGAKRGGKGGRRKR